MTEKCCACKGSDAIINSKIIERKGEHYHESCWFRRYSALSFLFPHSTDAPVLEFSHDSTTDELFLNLGGEIRRPIRLIPEKLEEVIKFVDPLKWALWKCRLRDSEILVTLDSKIDEGYKIIVYKSGVFLKTKLELWEYELGEALNNFMEDELPKLEEEYGDG